MQFKYLIERHTIDQLSLALCMRMYWSQFVIIFCDTSYKKGLGYNYTDNVVPDESAHLQSFTFCFSVNLGLIDLSADSVALRSDCMNVMAAL